MPVPVPGCFSALGHGHGHVYGNAKLTTMGIEMIAPHNPTRKNLTQDGRSLRRYKRRWHVERLFAWLPCSRRLITRFETKAANFLAFIKLRCVVLLLRRL